MCFFEYVLGTAEVRAEPLPKKSRNFSLLRSLYDEVPSSAGSTEPDMVVEDEMSRYVGSRAAPIDSNPLTFWQQNTHLYPNLSKVARKYLCIPATSTPSERLFSSAGFIVNARRALLDPESVNMLTFLSANMKRTSDL